MADPHVVTGYKRREIAGQIEHLQDKLRIRCHLERKAGGSQNVQMWARIEGDVVQRIQNLTGCSPPTHRARKLEQLPLPGLVDGRLGNLETSNGSGRLAERCSDTQTLHNQRCGMSE